MTLLTKRVRKNISLEKEDYEKINTYVKMHDKTFSGFLCQVALKEIEKEENISLNEYLKKNCKPISKKEQKEIEALNIDFDDLDGEELGLSDVL
ncbi:MAG: hypothetical protein CR967_00940 [Proteobacteria bacterium]|nr:MAG: hypothetical protein CR967_00940 [Pseudomonadota bacterium]